MSIYECDLLLMAGQASFPFFLQLGFLGFLLIMAGSASCMGCILESIEFDNAFSLILFTGHHGSRKMTLFTFFDCHSFHIGTLLPVFLGVVAFGTFICRLMLGMTKYLSINNILVFSA